MYSTENFSEEKLLEERIAVDNSGITSCRSRLDRRSRTYFWVFQVMFFLISLSTLLGGSAYRRAVQRCNCEDHMPMYSPALKAVQNTGYYQRFDGSFATPNIFKGTPNADLDAAWADITYENGSVIIQ